MFKELATGTVIVAPTVAVSVTGQKYLTEGVGGATDIRKDLDFDYGSASKRNEDMREMSKSITASKESAKIAKNKVINEINTMKVAVWTKMKTRKSDKESSAELLGESDTFDNKSNLADTIKRKIDEHKLAEAVSVILRGF